MKNSIFKSIVSLVLTISMLFSFSSIFFVNAAETKTGVIITTARLRTGPGTNHSQTVDKYGEKIALYKDDVVTILSEHESSNNDINNPIWYKVSIKRSGTTYTGYVSASLVIINTNSGALENVPEEYKSYIEQLLALHPDWNFVVYDTGIEWDSLFTTAAQCAFGTNVVHSSYWLSYRSTQSGAYNWRTDEWYNPDKETGWYQANAQLIAYYMDPRNFLNEQHIFMFEALSYDEKTQTLDGVKKILSGSFMDDTDWNANQLENRLVIIRNRLTKYSYTFIKDNVVKVLQDFFGALSIGSEINLAQLTKDLNTVPGVKGFYIRNNDGKIEKKMTLYMWNPLYVNEDNLTTQQTITNDAFVYPYFYDLDNIGNLIDIEDE